MFDWNLRFSDGAFTLKPKEFIKNLPYDSADEVEKVMSALLGNQGLSSVKLIKNLPMSATID